MAQKKLMPSLDSLLAQKRLITQLNSSVENLRSLDLFQVQYTISLSEEISLLWLLAKYGPERIMNICHYLKKLPSTLTKLQSVRYIGGHMKITESEAKMLVGFIQSSCPSLLSASQGEPSAPAVLAPPVSTCLRCCNQLVSYHTCKARYYTEEGAYLVDKVTLRCMECKLFYNITQYGNKSELGFRFYPTTGDTVEATDTVYARRSLLEFQCALA